MNSMQRSQQESQKTVAADASFMEKQQGIKKCYMFFNNLLKAPISVHDNMRQYIQDLINGKMDAEQFCKYIEVALKTETRTTRFKELIEQYMPPLRHELFIGKLKLHGIDRPPQHVLYPIHISAMGIVHTVDPTTKKVATADKTISNVHTLVPTTESIAITEESNLLLVPNIVKNIATMSTKQNLRNGMDTSSPGAIFDSYTNDVAAMCGINVAEEEELILDFDKEIGTKIRSCKDKVFLHMSALRTYLRKRYEEHALEEPNLEIAVLISHALEMRLKNIIQKIVQNAEQRKNTESNTTKNKEKEANGSATELNELQDVGSSVLLLNPFSKAGKKRRSELKIRKMLRNNGINVTAPSKEEYQKANENNNPSGPNSGIGTRGTASTARTTEMKRVNLIDLLLYMEEDPITCRSSLLHKLYPKN